MIKNYVSRLSFIPSILDAPSTRSSLEAWGTGEAFANTVRALSVVCPKCGVSAWEWCVLPNRALYSGLHAARLDIAPVPGPDTSCVPDVDWKTCQSHGNRWDLASWSCQTSLVLEQVREERSRQVASYGPNEDICDGTGPDTRWLLPLSHVRASDAQADFRTDYEMYEEETGAPTWVHLVREEISEAFEETNPERLAKELIQVAALCVSWVEKLQTRGANPVRGGN